MKRTITVILITFFVVLSATVLATAQDREQFRKERQDRNLRETIKIYMFYKMKAALELSDEQEKEIIPKVEEMEMQKHQNMEQRKDFLDHLAEMLNDEKTSNEAIIKELEQFRKMEEQNRKSEETILSQINETLSPRQRAQFLLFMVDFRRELQQKIDNVRRMQENERLRRKRGMEQNQPGGDDDY